MPLSPLNALASTSLIDSSTSLRSAAVVAAEVDRAEASDTLRPAGHPSPDGAPASPRPAHPSVGEALRGLQPARGHGLLSPLQRRRGALLAPPPLAGHEVAPRGREGGSAVAPVSPFDAPASPPRFANGAARPVASPFDDPTLRGPALSWSPAPMADAEPMSPLQATPFTAFGLELEGLPRRLSRRDAFGPAAVPDQGEETVMEGELQQATDAAVDRLRRKFNDVGRSEDVLPHVTSYIADTKARLIADEAKTGTTPPLLRERGGDIEINNALRMLNGARQDNDLTLSVQETPAMAHLVALVWRAIGSERPGVAVDVQAVDRENMRQDLITSLARCIENDGHRVCGVGQRHRLVDVLKGYFKDEAGSALDDVTSGAMLSALAEEFAARFPDEAHPPSPAEVEAFAAHATQQAATHFAPESVKMRNFTRDLTAYLRDTYPAPTA